MAFAMPSPTPEVWAKHAATFFSVSDFHISEGIIPLESFLRSGKPPEESPQHLAQEWANTQAGLLGPGRLLHHHLWLFHWGSDWNQLHHKYWSSGPIPITGGEIYPLLQNPKTSLIPLQYAYNLVGYLGSHLVWQVMYNHQLVCCPKCHVFCWTLKKLTLISFLLTSGHLRHREFGEVTRLVNKCRDCSTISPFFASMRNWKRQSW